MMTANGDQTQRMLNDVAEKIEKLQQLSKKGANGQGSTTPHQKRQIAQSAAQVGELLKQIEAHSPGFMEMFKAKLSGAAK
jgi:aminoglycoside phosphotransferase (APT) family kinase protein